MKISARNIIDIVSWLGNNVSREVYASEYKYHDIWHIWTAQDSSWRVVKSGEELNADIWCQDPKYETYIALRWL